MKYYSPLKIKEILSFATMWMKFGLPWRSSGEDPMLPMWGSWVQYLVGILHAMQCSQKKKKDNI